MTLQSVSSPPFCYVYWPVESSKTHLVPVKLIEILRFGAWQGVTVGDWSPWVCSVTGKTPSSV